MEVYALFGCNIIGPVVTSFCAHTTNVFALEASRVSTGTQYGTINQRDEISMTYVAPEDTSKLSFILFYPYGRLDLHVYDEYGNHIGINYEATEIEEQIEGSSYSGTYTSPQVIRIGCDLSNKRFTIKIVGIETIGEEGFALMIGRAPSLPPILNAFPGEVSFSNRIDPLSPFASTFFLVEEAGCQKPLENVEISITDLTDGCGHTIPSNSISIEPSMLSIPAGQYVGVVLNVTLPKSIPV